MAAPPTRRSRSGSPPADFARAAPLSGRPPPPSAVPPSAHPPAHPPPMPKRTKRVVGDRAPAPPARLAAPEVVPCLSGPEQAPSVAKAPGVAVTAPGIAKTAPSAGSRTTVRRSTATAAATAAAAPLLQTTPETTAAVSGLGNGRNPPAGAAAGNGRPPRTENGLAKTVVVPARKDKNGLYYNAENRLVGKTGSPPSMADVCVAAYRGLEKVEKNKPQISSKVCAFDVESFITYIKTHRDTFLWNMTAGDEWESELRAVLERGIPRSDAPDDWCQLFSELGDTKHYKLIPVKSRRPGRKRPRPQSGGNAAARSISKPSSLSASMPAPTLASKPPSASVLGSDVAVAIDDDGAGGGGGDGSRAGGGGSGANRRGRGVGGASNAIVGASSKAVHVGEKRKAEGPAGAPALPSAGPKPEGKDGRTSAGGGRAKEGKSKKQRKSRKVDSSMPKAVDGGNASAGTNLNGASNDSGGAGGKGADVAGHSKSGDEANEIFAEQVSLIPTEWTTPPSPDVQLSTFDKAVDLVVSQERGARMEVRGFKGFRSVRATHGVCEGDWYFEVTVLPTEGKDGAVRVGWSTRRMNVEGPVGRDAYGYGWRDRGGELVHTKQLMDYAAPFGEGDVIGCRLHFPDSIGDDLKQKIDKADRAWLDYRFTRYMEGKPPADEPVGVEGSWLSFYKNGQHQGVPLSLVDDVVPGSGSFKGILAGVYYPTVSVFKGGSLRVNFGPDFKHKIPFGARAFCECSPPAPIPVVDLDGLEEGPGVALASGPPASLTPVTSNSAAKSVAPCAVSPDPIKLAAPDLRIPAEAPAAGSVAGPAVSHSESFPRQLPSLASWSWPRPSAFFGGSMGSRAAVPPEDRSSARDSISSTPALQWAGAARKAWTSIRSHVAPGMASEEMPRVLPSSNGAMSSSGVACSLAPPPRVVSRSESKRPRSRTELIAIAAVPSDCYLGPPPDSSKAPDWSRNRAFLAKHHANPSREAPMNLHGAEFEDVRVQAGIAPSIPVNAHFSQRPERRSTGGGVRGGGAAVVGCSSANVGGAGGAVGAAQGSSVHPHSYNIDTFVSASLIPTVRPDSFPHGTSDPSPSRAQPLTFPQDMSRPPIPPAQPQSFHYDRPGPPVLPTRPQSFSRSVSDTPKPPAQAQSFQHGIGSTLSDTPIPASQPPL